MLIDESKADEILSSENNLVNILGRKQGDRNPNAIQQGNVEIRPKNNGGRRPGDANLTQDQREAAAVLAQFTPAQQLSEMSGISLSQISALKKGSHSTASYHNPVSKTKDAVDEQLVKVKDKALLKIMKSLDLLTDEKMEKGSLKDISTVMSGLSRVVSIGKNAEDVIGAKSAKIIVYSPKLQQINNYGTPLEVESQNL